MISLNKMLYLLRQITIFGIYDMSFSQNLNVNIIDATLLQIS